MFFIFNSGRAQCSYFSDVLGSFSILANWLRFHTQQKLEACKRTFKNNKRAALMRDRSPYHSVYSRTTYHCATLADEIKAIQQIHKSLSAQVAALFNWKCTSEAITSSFRFFNPWTQVGGLLHIHFLHISFRFRDRAVGSTDRRSLFMLVIKDDFRTNNELFSVVLIAFCLYYYIALIAYIVRFECAVAKVILPAWCLTKAITFIKKKSLDI